MSSVLTGGYKVSPDGGVPATEDWDIPHMGMLEPGIEGAEIVGFRRWKVAKEDLLFDEGI